MAQITIDVDIEKKGISKIDIPNEINPVEAVMILNTVQTRILSGVQLEPKSEIIQPEKKIKLA